MKGMVIGTLGVVHIFLAMFAIGGGMLMCYFEWLARRIAAAMRGDLSTATFAPWS